MYFASIVGPLGLINQTSVPLNTEFIVGGFYAPGDGGGGTFIWVPGSASSDEDFGIIFNAPNDPTGYFLRLFSGPVNVRWYGAIRGGLDPNAPMGYPSAPNQIFDVTPYVRRARDSQAFVNNGTLYFPKGEYPGSFEFTSVQLGNLTRNEVNIVGDGQGTVLMSAGKFSSLTQPLPILILGYRQHRWRWAKVSNLKIDGTDWFPDGIEFYNNGEAEAAGRWVIDRVYFTNCNRAVYKPNGNIGNHYIDCTWSFNNFGVYATGLPGKMHGGCDRYSGGQFNHNHSGCLHYEDTNSGGGQIIVDGTVIQSNMGWGIYIKCTGGARMSQNAICIRNVYFELNNYKGGAGDMRFEGVRSVRIDGCEIWGMTLRDSVVNMFNCVYRKGWSGYIDVDSKSLLIGYEQRYLYWNDNNIFVVSISHDCNPDIFNSGIPASLWGPLRAVPSTKAPDIAVSEHFDTFGDEWHDYGQPWGANPFTSDPSSMRVLGEGSNKVSMDANRHIWSSTVFGEIKRGKYCVWSIHTYLETNVPNGWITGEIIAPGGAGGDFMLGHVYFKPNQWVCSYGMRYVDQDMLMRLAFKTENASCTFYITDYQIVMFDDMASANSFVNSREFAYGKT